ncbi:uncharacterized protein LOC111864554 isoform X3 [Cryptotermes secundus]|uniref:uncharacterized protein LOC111864554 isoform X3 n=1 Tax=Cryptotermes secundus TaxID=105785 RepID=UPI001454C339|nr:uncharacterized protein LOC111864554 isoform X3 [Cryptotermes secundus]
MGDTKKKLDNLSYMSVDKETDVLDQLKCCQIYFQHFADPTFIGNTSQFYDNLRVLIGIQQKFPSELESHTREVIQDINISLLNTIASCSIPLDGQMMCSTAFCAGIQAVLETHERETLYSLYLNTDGYIFHDLGWPSIHISEKNVEVFRVCLCHGILQSNEVSNVLLKGSVVGSRLIYVMLNILEEACMKYTRLTSIAFKVLVSWIEKVCLQQKLNMTNESLRKIFSIINSNWESPISGVKAQNTRIFKLYLDVCSTNEICWYDCDAAFKSVTAVLCHIMEVQPWKMKSKYYMLNVLLSRYGVRKAFADFPDLAPGLISSLSYSHLASAGSDVYKTCLENMDENNWIAIFMTPLVEILTGTDVIKYLVSKNVSEMCYNGSAPLSVVVLTHAEAQLTLMKEDLVQAASSGSPLHGALTTLIRLATQSDGPEYGRMSTEEVERTVTLLEQTVSFLLDLLAEKSASTTDVAPSFAEMAEAIQCNIQQSLSDLVSLDEEGLHLSPAHQLVLNCVWLNLKLSSCYLQGLLFDACCTLASGLACNADCSAAVVKRCARLIAQVLMRCRHKGAIESAGVALSAFVKTVTSQAKERNHASDKDLHLMLEQLLTEFLHSIVHGGSKASVTRRSAGLSILIHRIVASDMQTGKPLLHMCMSQLLEIARTPLGHDVSSEPRSVLTDLPQAQALHFLKVLVQDSSLRQDITQYMSSVTIICFSNFSSPVWTVRNAALQLSGALIPKLVGQKKVQDEELTLGSSVSVEEFFSHFPELTEFMLTAMKKAAKCHPSQALQKHADLIPMLSLLAKVSVGSEIFISESLAETIAQYRALFLKLISSPIYHVRKLAAKAYERFMPFSSTYKSIVTVVDELCMHNRNCDGIHSSCLGFKENYLNGILLTLKYLLEKLKHDSENMSELKSKIPEIITVLKESVANCMIWDSCTYLNRVLCLELIEDKFNVVDTAYISSDETFKRILHVHKTLVNENLNNSFKPGLLLWAAKVVDVVVRKCYPQDLVSTWYNSYTLCSDYPDVVTSAFTSLKLRLLHDNKIDSAIKASLFIALLRVCLEITEECPTLFPLFDVMLVLMEGLKVNVVITFRELKKISVWFIGDRKNKSEYSKAALPVVTGLLSQYFAHGQCIELSTQILDFVLELSLCIKDRTDVMKYEEDFRLSAATAMHLLAPSLKAMLAEKSKEFSAEEVLKSTLEILLDVQLTLLQDEDNDVRKEAAKFVHAYTAEVNRTTMSMTVNPYASLRNLMKPDVLLTMLTVPQAMEFLWKKMHYTHDLESIKVKLSHGSHENVSITSPFDLGTNNIYNEETKIIDILGKSLLEIIKVANREERNELRKLIKYKCVEFKDDVRTVLSLLKRKESCGIYSASSYDETSYIVAKKLIYQSKVMDTVKIKGNHDRGSVMKELQKFLKFSTN